MTTMRHDMLKLARELAEARAEIQKLRDSLSEFIYPMRPEYPGPFCALCGKLHPPETEEVCKCEPAIIA